MSQAEQRSEKRERSGDTAELLRSGDALRVRQIVELLEDHGIVTTTPGLEHRSMLSGFGAHIEMVVRVAVEDLSEARELVRALDEAEPVDGEAEQDDEPEEAPPSRVELPNASYRSGAAKVVEEPAPLDGPKSPREKRFAFLLALVIPGGGHLYAWRYAEGLTLLVLQLTVLFSMANRVPFAAAVLPIVLVADLLGAFFWCDVSQGKRLAGRARRFAVPVAALLVIAALYLETGPLPRMLVGPGPAGACAYYGRCGTRSEAECLVLGIQEQNEHWAHQFTAECGACMREMDCDDWAACDRPCRWSQDDE